MTKLALERQPMFRWLQTVTKHSLKMLGLSIALGALLAVDARPAHACSCISPSVESSYNSSTDVVAARVLFGWSLGSERKYLARVALPYKGCLDDGDLVVLTTSASSASCGVQLEVGAGYLVNGQDSGSFIGLPELEIGLCGYNLPLDELSSHDREFLSGRNVCCGDDCQCADGSAPVACFADPCSVTPACSEAAVCVANYCGGCNAEFYDAFGNAACQGTPACADLLGHEFGPCDAVLGVGVVNGQCTSISGCSAPVPLFGSLEECQQGCNLGRDECQTAADCAATGCSGQVCAAEPVVTTCEFREEYACYQDPAITTCGCSAGRCDWDQTPLLAECLASASGQ